VRVANGVTLSSGTKYTLIDYASGNPVVPTLTSNIGSLTSGFRFVQDTTNTEDLVFEVAGPGITTPLFANNVNKPAKPAASVLDDLSATTTDSNMIAAISALQGLSGAEQADVLNRLAAQTNRATVVASTQTVNGALDTVQARIESARVQGFDIGLANDLQQGKLKLAANGDVAGLVDANHQHGFWVKGFGTHGDQDGSNSYAGYNSNTWGTAFGADTLLANNWLVWARRLPMHVPM
jgi:outer membrane autotransporter protein